MFRAQPPGDGGGFPVRSEPSINPVLERVTHQFVLAVEVQLLQDVPHVVLDSLLGDEEFLADLAIGVAPGYVLENLTFPLGQRLSWASRLLEAPKLTEYQRRQRW